MLSFFVNTYIKMFVLMTPFAVSSYFMLFTEKMDGRGRRRSALRTMGVVVVTMFTLYILGNRILQVLGLTLDAFRIGTGMVLFLSAISLVRGTTFYKRPDSGEDFAIVPLAIPITVGPGTIGYLLVLSAEVSGWSNILTTGLALLAAVITLGLLLFFSDGVTRIIGQRGLAILSKLTGLILSAMAAQIVFDGINNLLRLKGSG